MNEKKVTQQLEEKFPGKNIVLNTLEKTMEIICEIEPGKEKSVAIAVVDEISKHYHKAMTEVYEILKGRLELYVDNEKVILREGDKKTIKPGKVHWGKGKETWFRVTSTPGWTPEDHILVQ